MPFASVTALGLYRPPLSDAVTRLKYHDQPALGGPLGRALARELHGRRPERRFDAIVPLPLHPARLRVRGYNQAQCLAAGIATALQVPQRVGWLRRIRPTAAQAQLSRRSRLDNLAGAFAAAPAVAGARVLLVDDVLTTGATLTAAAAALRVAGASRVDAAVVAVSPLPVW